MTTQSLASQYRFRPMSADDLPLLRRWLAMPHVAEWWSPTPAFEELVEAFTPLTRPGHRDQGYIALDGAREVGYIQSYVVKDCGGGWWEEEQDPGARGIDQFLADETRWAAVSVPRWSVRSWPVYSRIRR